MTKSSFLTFVTFYGIIKLKETTMKHITQFEDLILKHHQHFFYDREFHIFTADDLRLDIEPIVFGNDGRNGISYKLYQDDELIYDVGMGYDEFRYFDYESFSETESFMKCLEDLETQIDAYVTHCLTDKDLESLSMEYGEIWGIR